MKLLFELIDISQVQNDSMNYATMIFKVEVGKTIDIDNSEENLSVGFDIELNLPPRFGLDEEKVVQEALDKTYSELEKILKENFSS